jgi:hypothetical protein
LRKLASTLTAAVAAVALLAAAAAAQEPVQLAGGRVSFVPPEGFKPMAREDVVIKFGRNGADEAPEHVYSNERQAVTIAFGFKGQNVPADALPEVKRLLEADFERRLPGIEWRAREFVELNGVRWIHFNMKTPAIDVPVVNHMYITILDGRLLMFNFNSSAAFYDAHKESLLKSARTITIKR